MDKISDINDMENMVKYNKINTLKNARTCNSFKSTLEDYSEDTSIFFESHMEKSISLYSRIITNKYCATSISDYRDNK